MGTPLASSPTVLARVLILLSLCLPWPGVAMDPKCLAAAQDVVRPVRALKDLSPDDQAALKQLVLDATGTLPGLTPLPPEQFDRIREQDKRTGYSQVVLSPAGRPLGFTLAFYDRGRDIVWIDKVGVLPEAQGEGLATRMLKATAVAAKSRGKTKLGLGVFANNERAIRLYERLGFRRVRSEGPFLFLEAEPDAVISR